MRHFLTIVPLALIESLSRFAGWLVCIVRPVSGYAAERRVRGFYWARRYGCRSLQVGRGVQFETPTRMIIGSGVTFFDSSHYVCGSEGHITIGDGSHIGRFCVLSGLGNIEIGKRCAISSNVCFYSITNDPDAERPGASPSLRKAILLGDDILIGAGVSILPGAVIGNGAVIGAGSVVKGDIPPQAIVAGSPARVIRMKESRTAP